MQKLLGKRYLGFLGFVMLSAAALLTACTPLYGYNLCSLLDDDWSIDDFRNSNSFFSDGLVAVLEDPYVFPSSSCRGPLILGWHEISVVHWIAPVPFSRSPP